MKEQAVGIQPAVLRWARESQGLSLEEVALFLKRDIEELRGWESGADSPTYAVLEKLAYGPYKRPVAAFFLPAPPPEPNLKQQFRSLPDTDLNDLQSDTRYQLRLARSFQISLAELNNSVNPAERRIFRDIQLHERDDIVASANAVRTYLGVRDGPSPWANSDEAFMAWRGKIEGVGVFVFKNSFKQKEISAFCLYDREFPIIYLNNSGARTRQIFSIFHELAHILLHTNSISLFNDINLRLLTPHQRHIERFCNAFTAELLIPSSDFDVISTSLGTIDDDSIALLARRYTVSREAILRRLMDKHRISDEYYKDHVERWNA